MADGADADRLDALGMLASALAGRSVAIVSQQPGDPPWTDGQTVFVDSSLPARANLEAIAVYASMIAAGSLDPDIVRPLARHSRLAKRYLAVEGHRALVANADVLPRVLTSVGDLDIAKRSNSPAESLNLASGKAAIGDPPPEFGVIRANKVLAACAHAARQSGQEKPGHVPRSQRRQEVSELDDGDVDDSGDPDLFTSPVGGGGFIGKWLKKMLSSARKTGSAGGPPGADNPTHRADAAKRGAHAVSSLAAAASENVIDHAADLAIPRREVSGMGFQSQELIDLTGARCSKSSPRQRDQRAQRSTMPSACDAHWHGSEWVCTAGTARRRATISTSMPRSRHTSN